MFHKQEYEQQIIFKIKHQIAQARRKGDKEKEDQLKAKAKSFSEHRVINYPALKE